VHPGSSIDFQGSDLLHLDETQLRALRGQGISAVFQDPMTALNPVLSIGTQMIDIQHRLSISRAEKRRRAAAMLSQVGIADAAQRLNDYPHQFSGGMRQRICIAMAMMMSPALLIADEPTTALDVTLEAQIIHLLQALRERFRCSMLFVSHNLGLIAELCDEVVVMYAGEVVERGTVEEIFHRARHPYTQLLLQCDPARVAEPRRELPTIPGSLPDAIHRARGCIFAPRCPQRFEPCEGTAPPASTLSPSHAVRCFRVDDV
jgi:peptide/nickel transport system ATP-binding protein